jgi:nitronate monooxygenase
MSALQAQLGVRYPIIQAPMGGGTSNPSLAAAVSNAGGLGSLGSAYDAPEKIATNIRELRKASSAPVHVNLFIPLAPQPPVDVRPMLKLLARAYGELGIPAPTEAPSSWPFTFNQQMDVVLGEGVEIFSFTFGMLERRYIDALHARKALVVGTATTLAEAQALAEAGVDAIALQGSEAGAHRGSFLPSADSCVALATLIQQCRAKLRVPVMAAGGIMNGDGIRAAIMLGADVVQMGTAFLLCDESGAGDAYKDCVLNAKPEDTQITRAFSGREARGIRNRFMQQVEDAGVPIPAFPIQNDLTRSMRRHAAKINNPEYLSLWSGQNGSLGRRMPAARLVETLVQEAELA